MSEEKYRHKHPSFGKITVSKPQGARIRLFGSAISHVGCVSLTIEHADLVQEVYGDRIFGTKHIAEVYMSEAQWAHMLSSFHDGNGTPCTVRWTQDTGYVGEPPEVPSIQEVQNEKVADEVKNISTRMLDIEKLMEDMLARPTVRKKDLEEMRHRLSVVRSHFNANLDHYVDSTKERMEKEVAKARIEIDALVTKHIYDAGLKALESKQLQLGEKHVKE